MGEFFFLLFILEAAANSGSQAAVILLVSMCAALLCSGIKTDAQHFEVLTACFSPAAFSCKLPAVFSWRCGLNGNKACCSSIWQRLENVSAGCQDAPCVRCYCLAHYRRVILSFFFFWL